MSTESSCWCLDWIILCWFMSHHICLLCKFSMPFLVKPASSMKSTHNCERNHWRDSWYQWKSSRFRACDHCKWYGYCNYWWSTCHTVVHTTCSAACKGVILYVPQYVLFNVNCSCTSLSSMVHHRRKNITSLHVVKLVAVEHSVYVFLVNVF